MARDFEPSASQQRAIALFGLTFDGTWAGAQDVLDAAGLPANGLPAGMSPAKAKKLSDDELRAAFGVHAIDATAASEAGAVAIRERRAEQAARAYIAPSFGERRRAARERENQNAVLRAHGYRWQRPYTGEGVDRYDADDTGWELVSSDSRVVTVSEALAQIGA